MLAFLSPSEALARMSSCNGINTSPQAKLVISQLITSGLGNPAYAAATGHAYQAASTIIGSWSHGVASVEVRVVSCGVRSPIIDASEFTPDVVTELGRRNVLFEFWGNIGANVNGNFTKAQGAVSYYFIPSPPSNVTSPPPRWLQHPYQSPDATLRDLVTKVFTQGRQFEILASIALAIDARRRMGFDDAHSSFCRAKLILQQEISKGTWKDLGIDPKMLASGIDDLVSENLAAAKNSNGYKGALSVPQIAGPTACPRA